MRLLYYFTITIIGRFHKIIQYFMIYQYLIYNVILLMQRNSICLGGSISCAFNCTTHSIYNLRFSWIDYDIPLFVILHTLISNMFTTKEYCCWRQFICVHTIIEVQVHTLLHLRSREIIIAALCFDYERYTFLNYLYLKTFYINFRLVISKQTLK